jgi:predicted 2-oxoglutarate/Fe(II)-dependent dioxygenase YbiX
MSPQTSSQNPMQAPSQAPLETPQQASSHSLTALGNEIYMVREVFSREQCQQIIQTVRSAKFKAAGIFLKTVDNRVRNNDLLQLGGKQQESQALNQLIVQQLAIVQGLLFETYGVKFPYAEACSVLRYRRGHFYKRHVDNILLGSRFQEVQQGIPTRDISLVGYLNDDFEGGETYFDRQGVTVKPEAGAVLAFPAYFTHPHASLTIRKGEKYAFTCWLFH